MFVIPGTKSVLSASKSTPNSPANFSTQVIKMLKTKMTLKLAITTFAVALFASVAVADIKAPTKPLSERVGNAEFVFVGKVINKVVEGDWARAEVLVETPLKNVEKAAKIPVTWRIKLGQFSIYDTAEGSQGIAILKDKHEGRYWLRSDKFEAASKLKEVKGILADAKEGE